MRLAIIKNNAYTTLAVCDWDGRVVSAWDATATGALKDYLDDVGTERVYLWYQGELTHGGGRTSIGDYGEELTGDDLAQWIAEQKGAVSHEPA